MTGACFAMRSTYFDCLIKSLRVTYSQALCCRKYSGELGSREQTTPRAKETTSLVTIYIHAVLNL